jgi:DNA-directed RNA polymerase subunit RPC12/RpoP
VPFVISGSCSRCSRQFRLTVDHSSEADIRCTSCGEQIVRRIAGYIYILSNPEMPGLFKIGQTTRSVVDRVAELNAATGVPRPFVIEAWFESTDPLSHEAEIHKLLSANRLPNREFFRIALADAADASRTVTGSDPKGRVVQHSLLPPSASASRPSIFKRWRCASVQRNLNP